MSLSSGTLNLKFMQRAKARAQASPSSTSTPASSAAATPAPSTPSAPTPAQAAEAAAEAEKWTLPSRFKRPNATAGPSRPKVSFVGSYLPFVEEAESSGGRRTFGAPKAKPEADDGEEKDDEDLEDAGVHGRIDEDASEPEAKPEDRVFRRPAGFGHKTEGSSTKKEKDMVRGMKRVSLKRESSPGSDDEEPVPKKRIKTEGEASSKTKKKSKGTPASSKHPTPSASKQPTPATSKESTPVPGAGKKKKASKADAGGDIPPPPKAKGKTKNEAASALDERERALKAAKKAAKKKAKA